jgi:tetratricopeptide (TPR) repeat protein
LPGADTEVERAKVLWKAGEAGDPEQLLDEARVLGMEASLRRDQRRLPEALDCLDRALAADRGGLRAHLLIKRAKTLEELDDYEESVATLRKALPLIDAEREPRLFWNLCFNLTENLFQVGRHGEATPLLEKVQKLAVRVGNGLGLVHLGWLRGRLAAGLGRPAEAEAALEQVRQEFLARDIPFDTGLVTLELAVLFQEQGRTAEVKKLARELAPVFQEQRVSREALATLMLFREAVEQETLTVELARSLLEDLRRARRRADTALAESPEKDPSRQRQDRGRPGKTRPYRS